jgi:hypothetical protein
VKDIGKTISDVFGGSDGASGIINNATGGAGAAGGSIPSGGGASSVGSSIGGIAGGINLATGIAGAVSGIIGNFQNAKQETTLNAIEHNTRYSMMFLGERGDGGILGVAFRIAEYLQYAPTQLDGLNAKLSDWLSPLPALVASIDERMYWAVARLDQIGADVQRGGANITINVSGAQSPQATAQAIAQQLRTQMA